MDEIADKFKSLFGGKSSKFKGSGHRLGTAEVGNTSHKQRPQADAYYAAKSRSTLIKLPS